MNCRLLGLNLTTALLSFQCSAIFVFADVNTVVTAQISVSATVRANYATPNWPQPGTADINGNTIAVLATSANASNNYITPPLTLTYGTEGSSLGIADFWTSGNTAPTGDGPLEILQTGTPILTGTLPGNTQKIGLTVAYTPCGTTTPAPLASGTVMTIPVQNSTIAACNTQHAAVSYTFTPPTNAPLQADTYSLPGNFSLTVQQGL